MTIQIELSKEDAQEIVTALSSSMIPAIRANTHIRTISLAIQAALKAKVEKEKENAPNEDDNRGTAGDG